jgi:hypothetical protein
MHASCDKLTTDVSVTASLAEHREHCHAKVQFLETFLHLHPRCSVKVRVSSDSVSQEESRHSVGSQNDEFLRGGGGGLGKSQIVRHGPADYFCTPPGPTIDTVIMPEVRPEEVAMPQVLCADEQWCRILQGQGVNIQQ